MERDTFSQPRDVKDDAVSSANANGESLELCCGGSKAIIGHCEDATHCSDLSALSAVVDYQPAERVLTAAAVAKLYEIEALLASHNQMLAFEPMDHGLNGTGRDKPRRGCSRGERLGPEAGFGWRRAGPFLGFHAVSGHGKSFKAGGRVVKNVTGFDLSNSWRAQAWPRSRKSASKRCRCRLPLLPC